MKRIGLIIGGVVALALAGSLTGIIAVWLSEEYSFPPTRRQCADLWNKSWNERQREEVAGRGYTWAVVDGWAAEGVYGYCSIYFLGGRSGGRWASYVSWVSGQSYPARGEGGP